MPTKNIDEQAVADAEQRAAQGMEDEFKAPEPEWDSPEDHAGEAEREIEQSAERPAAETREETPEQAEDTPVGSDDQPETTKEEVPALEETKDEGLPDDLARQVRDATGWPEYVVSRMTREEADRAIISSYMAPSSKEKPATQQQTKPEPEKTPEQPEPFDLQKYGVDRSTWDDDAYAQLQNMAGKLREEILAEARSGKDGVEQLRREYEQRQQQSDQRQAVEDFDRWIASRDQPDVYGTGPTFGIKDDSAMANRQQVADAAGMLVAGWQSKHGANGRQLPPSSYFYDMAERAVGAALTKTNNNSMADKGLIEQAEGTAQPTRRRTTKKMSRDEEAERDLEAAGFYDRSRHGTVDASGDDDPNSVY